MNTNDVHDVDLDYGNVQVDVACKFYFGLRPFRRLFMLIFHFF